jgi:hypothetical protein
VNPTVGDLEPPDQGLCYSGNKVLEIINAAAMLFDSSGHKLWAEPLALNTFMGEDPSWFMGDPRCFYDPGAKRWYATSFGISGDQETFIVALSVSATSDPSGVWNNYYLDVTFDGNDQGTCPCLGDQPLLGVDANGIYISTNAYSWTTQTDCSLDASGCFNGAQVYAISKSAILHGIGLAGTHFDTYCDVDRQPCFFGIGGNQQLFSLQPTLSANGKSATTQDGVEYVLGTTDWCAAPSYCPGNIQNAIVVGGITNTGDLNAAPPFAGPLELIDINGPINYEFPQLGVEQKTGPTPLADTIGVSETTIFSNDDRMNQTFYDSAGNVWGAANTEYNGTSEKYVGVAYWDVHPYWNSSGLNASFVHSGYIATKDQNDWFPSIVATSNGNVTVALDFSGDKYYPSGAVTTFTPMPKATGTIYVYSNGFAPEDGFTCYPELFGYGPPCRWGDYSSAQTNGTTVWVGTEWIPNPKCSAEPCDPSTGGRDYYANWGTRLGTLTP